MKVQFSNQTASFGAPRSTPPQATLPMGQAQALHSPTQSGSTHPLPVQTPQAQAGSPAQLVSLLGTQTQVGVDGMVQFNTPLLQHIVSTSLQYPQTQSQTLNELSRFLNQVTYPPALLEGLYLAQMLAQNKVPNTAGLYPAVSRLNTNPDPLIQIYLSGFYRAIQIPTTFGPMLATLINRSVTQYPLQSAPMFNITEEVGGTILQQIAEHTANETVKKLLPYLQQSPSITQGKPIQ